MKRLTLGLVAVALLALAATGAEPAEDAPAAAGASPEYALAKKAVDAKDWATAIRLLTQAAVQDDRNPDVQNLLGYAYRNAGRLDEAFTHYREALRLNPRHRGAHEYIGEAFLLVNDLAQAEQHLAALKQICLIPCEEHDDLARAIAAYRGARRN